MAAAFFLYAAIRPSGRRRESSLLQDMAVARANECEPAPVECRECGSVTDRDDRCSRKSLIEELIERRFAWLIQ